MSEEPDTHRPDTHRPDTDTPDTDRPTTDAPPPRALDVSGLVRAVRRRTRLNQRELAERAGVSRTTIGRIEARRLHPTVPVLEQILAVDGLVLVAADRGARVVEPMRDVPGGGLLDGADRRFPAHEDLVLLTDSGGTWWGDKYGLARPPETFHRSRGHRDAVRRHSQWDTRVHLFRAAPRPMTEQEWLRRHPEEG